eukprot:s1209_g16.t1
MPSWVWPMTPCRSSSLRLLSRSSLNPLRNSTSDLRFFGARQRYLDEGNLWKPAAQMLRRGSQSSIDLAKEAQASQPKRKQGSRVSGGHAYHGHRAWWESFGVRDFHRSPAPFRVLPAMLGAALPPRPPGGAPPKELPPAGQRRLPDGRRPDHLWSVLHRREESQGPRHRAESREEGGRRESRSLPSRPEMEMEPMQYPGQLPPLGWAPSPMPAMAMPNLAPENDWRDFKANLRPRMVVDGGAEAKEWLERRLDSALTEQRAELTRRFAGFEQSDKHFKDWVQREHEQLHSQLQQLRVSLQETGSQQQRLVGNLTAQGQKQDMRLQELEGQMAQALAQLQGLMNAVSAGALSGAGGNGGGTGEAAMGAAAVAASASANLEVLRSGLEREAQQRVQLGAETAEQLKQLSDMVYELNSRQQQQQSSQQQQLQQSAAQEEKDLVRQEARFAALEPSVVQLREELEEMRKMLYKCGADCAKRCDENEEICNKRLGGVQEAALNAARELWEEHQGVVVECKSSLSALQQILDSKDKIALQLRSLQQQQREEDKQEFWSQMQLRHEQLQAKLADAERALQTEQNTRIEEQQRYETVLSRLGLALEKAQAAWLRDSAKLSQEIHEAKRDFSIEMDGETRGVARRLADGLEAQQKLADELERKLAVAKTELGSVLERLDSTARAQQQELRDAEGRLMRQVNDVQTIQGGRTQQAVFDMKAELAKQEQVTAARLSALQKGQDELEGRAMMALNNLETRTLQKIQDSADLEREKTRNEMTRALEEERTERLRMDEELREEHLRHLAEMREQVDDNKKELNEIVQNAEELVPVLLHAEGADCGDTDSFLNERLVKRLDDQVTVERTKTREQIEAFIEEERSERLKAEAERLTSLQKRLQAHEELTSQRLSEQRARWETEVETLRQKLEAQALKDKQDLNKDLQDFVQEERQVTSGLADDMRLLGGECQSLAESFQKHQSATEQRLAHEAAALSAQLSVSSASLTALLAQHGQTQQLALETRAQEMLGTSVTLPMRYFDPLGFAKQGDREGFYQLRAAELKHGRVAMIAAVGCVVQHNIKYPGFEDVPTGIQAAITPPGTYGMLAIFALAGALELTIFKQDPDMDPGWQLISRNETRKALRERNETRLWRSSRLWAVLHRVEGSGAEQLPHGHGFLPGHCRCGVGYWQRWCRADLDAPGKPDGGVDVRWKNMDFLHFCSMASGTFRVSAQVTIGSTVATPSPWP